VIFEGLERARLDAIGVSWLIGVSKNLLAHPGADNDGVRWLAFEALGGHSAPSEKAGLVHAVKAGLKTRLYDELVELDGHVQDQERFAAAAATWAKAAAAVLPKNLVTPTESRRLPFPTRTVVRHLQAR
jgi:hypothetical protein